MPQKELQGIEKFESISINTFRTMLSAWWPAQSPSWQDPHIKAYQECTALLVTWSERLNSKWSLPVDCHCQRWHPKAGLVEQQDSVDSSSSPLKKGFLPAKSLSPASICSDLNLLGLKATDTKKTNTNKKAVQFGRVFFKYFMEMKKVMTIIQVFIIYYAAFISLSNVRSLAVCYGIRL